MAFFTEVGKAIQAHTEGRDSKSQSNPQQKDWISSFATESQDKRQHATVTKAAMWTHGTEQRSKPTQPQLPTFDQVSKCTLEVHFYAFSQRCRDDWTPTFEEWNLASVFYSAHTHTEIDSRWDKTLETLKLTDKVIGRSTSRYRHRQGLRRRNPAAQD